jgi:hypothetical protein
MTTDPDPGPDSVSLDVEASPDRLYELVSDVTRMGRLSPECTGGRWIGGEKRPVAGAKFLGFNRRGIAWWFTVNQVVTAEPGREFAFETRTTGVRWRYRFTPRDAGTTVTESRQEVRDRPLTARLFARLFLGGIEEHDDELREGMATSLSRLKALAEE